MINDYLNNFSGKRIIIGGDFNTNTLVDSKQTTHLLNLMLEYNFKQHINEPTRINKNGSTCLDLIFTNFSSGFKTQVRDEGFSDHRCTILKLALQKNENHKHILWYQTKRIFSPKNIDAFKLALQQVNWSRYILLNQSVKSKLQLV